MFRISISNCGIVGRRRGCRRRLVLVFVLVMYRSKPIIWKLSLVIGFFLFRFEFPDTFLLKGELMPAVTYYFREGAVISLDGPRNVLLPDKICTEEHESVGWTRDITLRAALSRWAALA